MSERKIAQEWLRKFILTLRQELRKRPELKEGLSNLDWFLSPCQVIVLWVKHPEAQLFIVTHFEDIPDMEIVVYGPIEAYEYFNVAEKIASMEWWNKPLPESTWVSRKIYRDSIEDWLVYFKNFLATTMFAKPMSPTRPIKLALTLSKKEFLWVITGNLFTENPSCLVTEILEETERSIAQRRVQGKGEQVSTRKELKRSLIEGYGAYIYPFVWIDKAPKLTLRDKLHGAPNEVWRFKIQKEVFRTEILSTEVFIFNDGFLFIGTTDERKVLEIFELLIASMLLNNIPALTCTRIDFLKGKYDKEKKFFEEIGGDVFTLRSWAMFSSEIIRRRCYSLRIGKEKVIPQNILIKIIEMARTLTKNEEIKKLSRSWARAYTHQELGEPIEAFLRAWYIVEYWVEKTWEHYVMKKVKTDNKSLKETIRRLTKDPTYMTLDHKIRLLYIVGLLDATMYRRIVKLKDVRNKIVHDFYEPSENEVKEIFELATQKVLSFLEKYRVLLKR